MIAFLVIAHTVAFAIGLAAHIANIRSERRFNDRVATMMRVGTDARGRA